MDKKNLKDNIIKFILISLIGLIILIFSEGARATLFAAAFIISNIFLTLYKRYVYFPVEFEILSLGIVLCTVSYGLLVGLVVAILGGILYAIYSTSLDPFTFPMLLGYSAMALMASLFPGMSIIYLGILANILHNMLVFSIYHFMFGYDPWKNIMFSGSNIVINIILFYNIAPFLLMVMN